MSYYDRTEATHLDGSPIFATRGDEDSERQVKIGGCVRQVKSRSDVEPVIEVPISKMTLVA